MKRNSIIGLGVAATAGALVAGVLVAGAGSESAATDTVTFLDAPVGPEQLALGEEVYAESCAACHGASLEGQPDWRRRLDNGLMPAPPHDETGHTWHHADQQLFDITKNGLESVVPGYESAMPVFDGILSDEEIAAVLGWIKSTWPERQRAAQAEVTANDKGGS